MDFNDVLKNRHSCRKFVPDKPLTEDQLSFISYAIERTPSAGNLRAFDVCIVIPSETQHQLSRAAWNQNFVEDASCNFIFFADPIKNTKKYGDRGLTLYSVQDATIACTHAHLAATYLGLGSCWVGAFDEKRVSKILGAHWSKRPVAILSIGYPA
jgi:nitroreductase